MPYEPNPPFLCLRPPDPDVELSRYISLSKFQDLLTTRALFFCRIDKLLDPLEGVLPKANRQLSTVFGIKVVDPPSTKTEEAFQFSRRTLGSFRRHCLVNCWRLGGDESREMWGHYAPAPDSVMIVSTFSQLADSFFSCTQPIFLSAVRYLDTDEEPEDERSFFNAVTRKTPPYAIERELRAMTSALPAKLTPEDYWNDQVEVGMHIDIDLNTLLARVVLSPVAADRTAAVVEKRLSAVGLSVPVVRSSL